MRFNGSEWLALLLLALGALAGGHLLGTADRWPILSIIVFGIGALGIAAARAKDPRSHGPSQRLMARRVLAHTALLLSAGCFGWAFQSVWIIVPWLMMAGALELGWANYRVRVD